MQFPLTVEELFHFIPLATGYAIILILFLRSRREVKRFHGPEAARAVPDLAPEGRGTRAGVRGTEASLVGVATAQSRLLAERAELLRTYRRREMAPRIAPALAAGERR